MEKCKHVENLICNKKHAENLIRNKKVECINCQALKSFKKLFKECYYADFKCYGKYSCNDCEARDLAQNLIDYNDEPVKNKSTLDVIFQSDDTFCAVYLNGVLHINTEEIESASAWYDLICSKEQYIIRQWDLAFAGGFYYYTGEGIKLPTKFEDIRPGTLLGGEER